MRRTVLAVIVFLWAAMPFSASAQGPMGMMHDDDDMGMGMMMGGGKGCGGEGALGRLNLTDEQETKVRKIFEDLRREHWPLMGKMMDERSKLRDLYREDTLDAKKITAVTDTMYGLRKQMLATRIEALNKVRALLTKEQLAELKTHGGWGGCNKAGCGMAGRGGRGGGGPMMHEMMRDN